MQLNRWFITIRDGCFFRFVAAAICTLPQALLSQWWAGHIPAKALKLFAVTAVHELLSVHIDAPHFGNRLQALRASFVALYRRIGREQ